ncbi:MULTISPECIES: helix-turn-helix domain-containing protein [Arthrobacter]|uniref:DNA-binding protein n=1 Tax=Arthrobacter terricola TaxID=2547396 RepID=A0A4R5KHK6_9MICC|nr:MULTISPECIES: helix-turn-helix domain-containing protein [Arthrobacter]MBT8159248.1 helix-turn-helix domain-containing protein [Arthrobacter sp. GN70]TDF94921.1 DNA-binding protein [Arthrobacter terricola]
MSADPFVETTQSASAAQPTSSYLTVSDVAEYLNVSRMTVYRLVHSGEMPAARFGKSFRIEEADMEAYRQRAAVVIHPES